MKFCLCRQLVSGAGLAREIFFVFFAVIVASSFLRVLFIHENGERERGRATRSIHENGEEEKERDGVE